MSNEPVKPVSNDANTWVETIWQALWAYRETQIPEGDAAYDAEWDEICTAMAWLSEELGIEDEEVA